MEDESYVTDSRCYAAVSYNAPIEKTEQRRFRSASDGFAICLSWSPPADFEARFCSDYLRQPLIRSRPVLASR
jgi:hypothetical protein